MFKATDEGNISIGARCRMNYWRISNGYEVRSLRGPFCCVFVMQHLLLNMSPYQLPATSPVCYT
ncbi:hypothetical protein EYF80_039748 [Liparis tanakae]|uniref:Uncharacterized protein n=1 Tax=Liparis tanakae TaxID=230148 RepID=A0A4Z2GA28_9TELE|nr:hypothetical protein EYF80_039748 [Liparis tanakae]